MTEGTPVVLRDPLPGVPARPAGSVRRTMHVDVGRRGEWSSPLAMEGAARDLRTGAAGPDDVTVLAEARVRAGFDTARCLTSLTTTPGAPWAQDLVGARAGGGFRRHLDEVVPPDEAGSLLRQVLDDMPAAALISGYAWMRLARREGHHPANLMPPGALDHMTDLCSGWRAGGAAVRGVVAGEGVPMQDCPPVPVPEPGSPGADPHAWHELAPLGLDWMRRRRCIDVTAGPGGEFGIWAMFRDTVGEDGGGEAVLHEYAVRAGGVDGVLGWVEAEPRVLPFPECPAAADTVGALVGTAVATLAAAVPETLTGVASCTHLNDLLRALGGVRGLLLLAGGS
ncbi:MAG TPA: DUF2889 domain-containing protein [Acidimicrobiales bacterium]|nr:DUF2889 domain-containing protein [Acidimicrobiales bacterium]